MGGNALLQAGCYDAQSASTVPALLLQKSRLNFQNCRMKVAESTVMRTNWSSLKRGRHVDWSPGASNRHFTMKLLPYFP